MPTYTHKFNEHAINENTEVLILGTFVYDFPDSPDFFYGRTKSFLWHLLPSCFNLPSLKEADLAEKKAFMLAHKIDFADVIQSVSLDEADENHMTDDSVIDSSVNEWTNLIALVDSLPQLKAVYFTRKTFNSIPNIRQQISALAKHCQAKNIRICKLETPAKYFDEAKQQQWTDTIVTQKTCLRV